MLVTDETRKRAEMLFPSNPTAVIELLEQECGSGLPGVDAGDPQWAPLVQRVRFAVLKVSGGDLTRLKSAIDMARQDWRDLLMEADFAEPKDHLRWTP